MSISFVTFNNLANNIAMSLDMRQSGYDLAMTAYPNIPTLFTQDVEVDGNGNIIAGHTLKADDIILNYDTQELRSGVYHALDTYKFKVNYYTKLEAVNIPFTEVNNITVTTGKPVNSSDGEKMAGNTIKVEINFSSKILGDNLSIPNLKAVGYNVIT